MSASFGRIEAILEKYSPQPEHLVSALQDIQTEFNYIPPEALSAVCEHVGVPVSRGWAVATFYKSFSLEPKGEHEVCVCMGTACHVKGSTNIYDKLRRDLGIAGLEGTTSDLKFSLNKVRCLGCCSMGPVVRVDDEIHGHLNQRKAGQLVRIYGKR